MKTFQKWSLNRSMSRNVIVVFCLFIFLFRSLKQIIELIINFLELFAYHLFIFISSSSYFFLYFVFDDRNQIGFCFLLTHWTIVSHHIWMVCSFNWREKKRIQNEPSIAAIVAIGYGVRKNCFVWAVNRINGHARDSLVIP